jgi:hypothetical protein
MVVLLILCDVLTYFYYPGAPLSKIFLATREQTPLTWISALSLFFIALACFSVYHVEKKKVWYLLSGIFFYLSMDDAVYLHERLSGAFQDHTDILNGFPTYV